MVDREEVAVQARDPSFARRSLRWSIGGGLLVVVLVVWWLVPDQSPDGRHRSGDLVDQAVEIPRPAGSGGPSEVEDDRDEPGATLVPPLPRETGWCLPLSGQALLTASPHLGLRRLEGVSSAPDRFDVAWRVTTEQLGSVPGRPVVTDGIALMGTAAATLFAVDVHDGREIWKAPGVGGRHPPWTDGEVVVHHEGTRVTALDGATGRELWSYSSSDHRRIVGSVKAYDGRVYVSRSRVQHERFASAPTDVVTVLEAETGRELHQIDVLDPVRSVKPTLLDLAIADGVLVTLEEGGTVVGRVLDDGRPLWRWPVDHAATAIVAVDRQAHVLVGLDWRPVPEPGGSLGLPVMSPTELFGSPCHVELAS